MRKSPKFLCFIFIFTMANKTSANFKENMRLILDVYNYYKCSSIIFFYSSEIGKLPIKPSIF